MSGSRALLGQGEGAEREGEGRRLSVTIKGATGTGIAAANLRQTVIAVPCRQIAFEVTEADSE